MGLIHVPRVEPPLLELQGLSCGYGTRTVLADIGFSLSAGEILYLLGPNGVGKTTLFKTILRQLPAIAGQIRICGEDVGSWHTARFAAMVGYVPQAHTPPFPFRVFEVAAMGRAAHFSAFGGPSRRDYELAEASLQTLGIVHLRDRPYTDISGGERQLVLVARALAQQPRLMVMDEPTSNLDFGNQVAVLDEIQALVESQDIAVIITSHDPNHALRYGSKVAAIKRGGAIAVGKPEIVITEDYLLATYGVATSIVEVACNARRIRACVAIGRRRNAEPTARELRECDG